MQWQRASIYTDPTHSSVLFRRLNSSEYAVFCVCYFFSSFTSFARIFYEYSVCSHCTKRYVSRIEIPYMCMVILCLRRRLILCFHFVACEPKDLTFRLSLVLVVCAAAVACLYEASAFLLYRFDIYFNTNPIRSHSLSHSFNISFVAHIHSHAFQFTLYTPIQCAPSHLLRPILLSFFSHHLCSKLLTLYKQLYLNRIAPYTHTHTHLH